MPELPEVEGFRRCVEKTSLHQTIREVEVRNADLLAAVSVRRFRARLKGRQFIATRRRGKYLGVRLDDDSWLVLHFGMDGDVRYLKAADQDPDFARVVFHFENGFRLAYLSIRRFGRLSLTGDFEAFLRKKRVGPDALDVDFKSFRRLFERRKAALKSALMNQAIVAGIGNIYADEICFQARVHPLSRLEKLAVPALRSLFDQMRRVLRKAIARRVPYGAWPRSFLANRRAAGETCPRCGGAIARIPFGQRSCYFCPACQRKKS